MQNSTNLAYQIDAAREHLNFQHDPATTDGWIAVAKKDPVTSRFKQYHYKPDEIASNLTKWMGDNVYFSQNTFYRPQRRVENIRQLRSLYVDLDCYNLGLTPEWVRAKLDFDFFGQTVPDPNLIIYSGRGLVLIWELEPLPYMAIPLWQAVENHLCKSLEELGADTKATDPARIFRLSGSTNSKSHTLVKAEYRHQYRYDLHQIQFDYLPELSPATPAPQTRRVSRRQGTIVNLFNTYTLHLARAADISRLVEMRSGNVIGYREIICFLYRYYTCCYTQDPQKALEDVQSLNAEFSTPLSIKEVEKATKSAQKAWEAKSNPEADKLAKAQGFPGAGYNLTNTKLIEWLGITPEEQRELSTIIDAQEKRRRNTEAKRKIRREAGAIPRSQYLQQSQDKKEIIVKAIQDNPHLSVRKIAEITGAGRSTVQRIKASMQDAS